MKPDMELQYDKIYKYCYYKLGQREAAEDITQEAFLRFYEKSAYQSMDSPLKMLYTIARNLCMDEYRKEKFRPVLQEELSESEADERGNPEVIVVGNQALRMAMEKLEETERDIIFLRFVNEEKFNVIARMLGMSRFAVYRRYDSAIKNLRKELEGYEVE